MGAPEEGGGGRPPETPRGGPQDPGSGGPDPRDPPKWGHFGSKTHGSRVATRGW